jgi:uncharacterized membrane protein YvbJ
MPYCPKCGHEVGEEMDFCPKCGAALKGEQPRDIGTWGKEFGERMAQKGREFGERMSERARLRAERRAERYEKYEKTEVHEKHEFTFIGPLIGGLILIFLGLMLYLQVTGSLNVVIVGALFFVVIGVIIIAAGIFATTMTRRRHPAP